ncbi:2OG-Fe(II) oxygenase family protein [Photorhabdus heterorhabditis]|uniref:2OG-Fe(II) oxygenase family protein n=1 Tax=Photorhabdus heterorhabditis TaxID=880156 RepID=UPI001562523D|nr:2OG-Fe(II) oxygenase family protein [Photorhabdus heterorhabditis]NRN30779.1 isopenicillin N synthase family oxygenase [Photorhabdus heterorhabditis subsp. aluminescens]
MTNSSDLKPWSLKRRAIYQDVYNKRVDNRPVKIIAKLQKAYVENNSLIFESSSQQDQALNDGIFFLKIPFSFQLSACDMFSRNFYKGDNVIPYGEFRKITAERFGDPLLGFHTRTNQIEQFLLEHRFWKGNYPPEIEQAGEELTTLGHIVLRSILKLTNIPEIDWSIATGGCSDSLGSYHLTFNHYRPQLEGIGLASHKDDGFMTILRSTSPGLEINRNNQWEAVNPDPAYFIINFGLSMEVLTRDSAKPIRAIMHRVKHQTIDRSSFGHFTSSFCEPGAEAGIYSYSSQKGLHQVCNSRDLINANDEEIYLGTLQPRGLNNDS